MEWLLPLVGGLGLGSLLKSIADHLISRRSTMQDRFYQEKREAYLGLLSAVHQASVAPSKDASARYGLWQTRCQLFGSPDVVRFAEEMVVTNAQSPERNAAFSGLLNAMRRDLGAP